MRKTTTYGLAINGRFYSNRMEFPTSSPNGIYSLDMTRDDFRDSMDPADIDDAIRFFRKKSKIKVVRGVSFRDSIVPENPVSFNKLPIRVLDAVYDEFEEVEVAILHNGLCYFLRIVSTDKAFALMDLKDAFDSGGGKIDHVKSLSPDMRVVYMFHILEKEREEIERRLAAEHKEAEKRRRKMAIPVNAIRAAMERAGTTVRDIRKVNRGYEVVWEAEGHRINTLLDSRYRVIEAGFCVSNYDDTQSVQSVSNLLRDYVRQGDWINLTRTAD